MSPGAVAIFVKTPGFSPVKTRLAKAIGKRNAEAFHLLASKAVAEVVSASSLAPYWAVAEESALSKWTGFTAIHQGEGGLGARLHHVYSKLSNLHPFVLLIGADSPQLRVAHLAEAADIGSRRKFVMGPSRDGGFYLFGGSRPISREAWESVPYSKSDTREKLVLAIGEPVESISLLSDVDELNDLVFLRQELTEITPCLLPAQLALLEWISRLDLPTPSGA